MLAKPSMWKGILCAHQLTLNEGQSLRGFDQWHLKLEAAECPSVNQMSSASCHQIPIDRMMARLTIHQCQPWTTGTILVNG